MTVQTKKTIRTLLPESELAELDRVRERQRLTRTEAVRAAIRWYVGTVGSLPPAEDATPEEIEAIRRGEEEFARGETRRLEDVQHEPGIANSAAGLSERSRLPPLRSTAHQPCPKSDDRPAFVRGRSSSAWAIPWNIPAAGWTLANHIRAETGHAGRADPRHATAHFGHVLGWSTALRGFGLASSLTITNLDAGYGSVRVLDGVSLEVAAGETVVLLGTNGNGKSTLMKCVMGMLRPSAGSITAEIDGKTVDLVGRTTEAIVDLGITLVPEGRRLFPKLTVEENLLLGAFRPTARAEIGRNLKSPYITFPVLRERRRQLAGSMPGGEQQMLALARALMSAPKILLIDEPSVGLAPVLVKRTIDKFQESTAVSAARADGGAKLQSGGAHRRSRLCHRPRPYRIRGPIRRRPQQ